MMNPKHKAAALLFVAPAVLLALASVVGAFRKPTKPATSTAPAAPVQAASHGEAPTAQAAPASAPSAAQAAPEARRPAGLPLSAAMQPGAVDRMAQAADNSGQTWAALGAMPAPEAAPLALVDIAAAAEAPGWQRDGWMRSTRAGWWRVDTAGSHTVLLRVADLPGGFGVVDSARCRATVSGRALQTPKHNFTDPKTVQVAAVIDLGAGWHEVSLQCDVAGDPAQRVRAELAATEGEAAPVVIPLFQPAAGQPAAGAGGGG